MSDCVGIINTLEWSIHSSDEDQPKITSHHLTSREFTSHHFTSPHFTTLHSPFFTSLHFWTLRRHASKTLHFTSLHFTPHFSFPCIFGRFVVTLQKPFTSHHFTSNYFTTLHFPFFTSLHFRRFVTMLQKLIKSNSACIYIKSVTSGSTTQNNQEKKTYCDGCS